LDLAPQLTTEVERGIYINTHLKFLQERGFLTVRREATRQLFAIVELTGHGHEYFAAGTSRIRTCADASASSGIYRESASSPKLAAGGKGWIVI
jgi:hypothetical protein